MAERDGEEIKHEASGELPAVDSPPLSPAGVSSEERVDTESSAGAETSADVEVSADSEVSGNTEVSSDVDASVDAQASGETENEAVVAAAAKPSARFQLSRRNQRRFTMAAWVALIAGFGALFGGAIGNGLTDHRNTDIASLNERKAMQQSIDQLAKEVSDLKTKLAAAENQVAKTSARADSASSADITGSIPTAHATSVPLPRPAPPRIAAATGRLAVVRNWRVLRARGDFVDVEGRDGIYEVVPGAVLPGIGPVQSIERRGGRWVVVTPKGLIVSARDRGYFEDF